MTATMEAVFNDVVLARSEHTVRVEGNVYFPPESVAWQHLSPTPVRSLCFWKGVAGYFTVTVGGAQSRNAAWTYRHSSPLARRIKNHVAFWNGVEVRAVSGRRDDEA